MTHPLAAAFQQASRIRELSAVEEPDVYMKSECIDVSEWRISQARNRTSVMHKLPNLISTLSHDLKPLPSDGSQFNGLALYPRIYRRIPLDSTVKLQHLIHRHQIRDKVNKEELGHKEWQGQAMTLKQSLARLV